MLENHIRLSGRTGVRKRTMEWIVRATEEDRRDWLASAPVCTTLGRRGISHVGVACAIHPYEVKRPSLNGMFVMACVAGQGEVLLENRWRKFGAGTACLAPPRAPNAYRCTHEGAWEFVWVRYLQPPARRPIVVTSAPLLAAFDGRPLWAAVLGLHHEAHGSAQPAIMDRWVDLIEDYVRRFTQPWREDERLRRLWEEVARDLSREWTIAELASINGMSDEQLRRLCLKALGRTPRAQLTWMRMERAAERISASGEKLEAIAREVGYDSVFSFSNTFQRLFGRRPSEYRTAADPKERWAKPTASIRKTTPLARRKQTR